MKLDKFIKFEDSIINLEKVYHIDTRYGGYEGYEGKPAIAFYGPPKEDEESSLIDIWVFRRVEHYNSFKESLSSIVTEYNY